MTQGKDKYYQPSRHFFKENEYLPLPEETDMILVTWQFKNPENIGSIIRVAANIGLRKVIVVNDPNLSIRSSKIKKTSQAAENFVTIVNSFESDYFNHIPSNHTKIALETSLGSTNIYSTPLPDKLALFIGNEIKGLPDSILSQMDQSIHIPMPGPISSMNVSHATSVCAFEWYRQKIF